MFLARRYEYCDRPWPNYIRSFQISFGIGYLFQLYSIFQIHIQMRYYSDSDSYVNGFFLYILLHHFVMLISKCIFRWYPWQRNSFRRTTTTWMRTEMIWEHKIKKKMKKKKKPEWTNEKNCRIRIRRTKFYILVYVLQLNTQRTAVRCSNKYSMRLDLLPVSLVEFLKTNGREVRSHSRTSFIFWYNFIQVHVERRRPTQKKRDGK